VCREGLETEVPKQGEKLNEADTSCKSKCLSLFQNPNWVYR
jgi:hypothetical protein